MLKTITYHSSYHKQVIDLLKHLWENKEIDEIQNIFEWKYLHTPFTSKPLVFLMLDEERTKIVGFRGYTINEYILNGEVIKVGIMSDATTHPDYRCLGILSNLTKDSLYLNALNKFPEFYLATSSGWASTKGYLKNGFEILSKKRPFYKIFITNLVNPFQRRDDFVCDFFFKKEDVEFRLSKELIYNEFFTKFNFLTKNYLQLKRSEEFLRWRYNKPQGNYVFLTISRKGKLITWASFSFINERRLLMLDFLFEDKAIFQKGLNIIAKRLNISLIQTWFAGRKSNEEKKLGEVGFIALNRFRRFLKKEEEPPVLVKPVSMHNEEADWFFNGLDLRKKVNWRINLISSDGV